MARGKIIEGDEESLCLWCSTHGPGDGAYALLVVAVTAIERYTLLLPARVVDLRGFVLNYVLAVILSTLTFSLLFCHGRHTTSKLTKHPLL
jgi:hypothetical protein